METDNLNLLTPRQRQVFEYLAWGATYKEIAVRLNRSVHTIINLARGGCERLGIYPSQIPSWWFCVNFKISFDISPIKRKIGAVILFFMFCSMSNHDDIARMGRRIRGRQGRKYEWISDEFEIYQ